MRTLQFISRASSLCANRRFCAVIVVLLGAAYTLGYDTVHPKPESKLHSILRKLQAQDPEAADLFARMEDASTRDSLEIAGLVAGGHNNPVNLLNDMAREMKTTRRIPHQARLAKILEEKSLLRDEGQQQEFLLAHATAAQALAAIGETSHLDSYLIGLESAARDPLAWSWVKDDPLALLYWTNSLPEDLQAFYHENRDWLQGALLDVDPSGEEAAGPIGAHRALLVASKAWTTTARALVVDYELGGPGLATLAHHGPLIDRCFTVHGLDIAEVCSVLFANPDRYAQPLPDPGAIRSEAAFLASIAKDHSAVWLSAMTMPLALKLHEDAPADANAVLASFGSDMAPVLIYGISEDPAIVRMIARSLLRWGDGTIYVLAKYAGEKSAIVEMFEDPDVGMRTIPFMIKFQNEAFDKVADDPDWCDRYFESDGNPKSDNWAFLESVPGGSLVLVCKNAAQGYPNEWSELGWAAFDVVDIAMLIASGGSSSSVTTAAKTAAKQSAKAATRASRTTLQRVWRSTLEGIKEVGEAGRAMGKGSKALVKGGVLARTKAAAALSKDVFRLGGKTITAGFRFTRALIYTPIHVAIEARGVWKGLSPAVRKGVVRTLAVVMTLIIVKDLPEHLPELGRRFGEFVGKFMAGGVKMLAAAIGEAITEFVNSMSGGALGRFTRWLPSVLALLLATYLWRSGTERKKEVQLR